MLLFLIAALRAIVEMLCLSLLALGAMAVLAGERRRENPIYRLFELVTRGPRRVVGGLIPGHARPVLSGVLCFLLLFVVWIALAAWRLSLA